MWPDHAALVRPDDVAVLGDHERPRDSMSEMLGQLNSSTEAANAPLFAAERQQRSPEGRTLGALQHMRPAHAGSVLRLGEHTGGGRSTKARGNDTADDRPEPPMLVDRRRLGRGWWGRRDEDDGRGCRRVARLRRLVAMGVTGSPTFGGSPHPVPFQLRLPRWPPAYASTPAFRR